MQRRPARAQPSEQAERRRRRTAICAHQRTRGLADYISCGDEHRWVFADVHVRAVSVLKVPLSERNVSHSGSGPAAWLRRTHAALPTSFKFRTSTRDETGLQSIPCSSQVTRHTSAESGISCPSKRNTPAVIGLPVLDQHHSFSLRPATGRLTGTPSAHRRVGHRSVVIGCARGRTDRPVQAQRGRPRWRLGRSPYRLSARLSRALRIFGCVAVRAAAWREACPQALPPAGCFDASGPLPNRSRRLPGQGSGGLVDEAAEVIGAGLAVERASAVR